MDFGPTGRKPDTTPQSKNQPNEGETPGGDQAERLENIPEGGHFPRLSLYSTENSESSEESADSRREAASRGNVTSASQLIASAIHAHEKIDAIEKAERDNRNQEAVLQGAITRTVKLFASSSEELSDGLSQRWNSIMVTRELDEGDARLQIHSWRGSALKRIAAFADEVMKIAKSDRWDQFGSEKLATVDLVFKVYSGLAQKVDSLLKDGRWKAARESAKKFQQIEFGLEAREKELRAREAIAGLQQVLNGESPGTAPGE